MKIDEIKLKETTAGATGAGSIAVSIGSVGNGGMISRTGTKKKSKKNKNPHGIDMPKDSLFAGKVAEGTKPKYKNKQVKGKDPMPKLTKPTAGHESPHPFRGKLVGEDSVNKTSLPPHLAKFFDPDGNLKPEVSKRMSKKKDYKITDVTPKGYGPDFKRTKTEGSIPDDKAAGIKWADDPDWKKLHDMDLDMVQDFIAHKEETNEAHDDFDMDDEIASYDGDDEDEPMSDSPYAIIWHGQYAEWYGDGDPNSGEGRYKMKGDAGEVLAKNIPTYAQAEKLLPRVSKMGHVGERGEWGKDHSVVMQASDPMIVPMKELGEHFYSYDSDMQQHGDIGNDDHHDVIDLAGVEERKLSEPEKKNKEHNVKTLKKHKKSFSKYGKDADSVMYAVATRDAKKGKKYK